MALYNAKQFVDEVKLRLSRHNVVLSLGEPDILMLVNEARRDVQLSTMGLFREFFGKVLRLDTFTIDADLATANQTLGRTVNVWRTVMPIDFIDTYVVNLRYQLNGTIAEFGGASYTNVTFDAPCRRVNKRELFGVQGQSWNTPTLHHPIYAVEKKLTDLANPYSPNYIMYLAGLDVDGTTTIFDVAEADSVMIEMWYVAALPALEEQPSLVPGSVPDTELAIPHAFEELVILNAMMLCLQKTDNQEAMASVKADQDMMMMLIEDQYNVSRQKRSMLLESRQPIISQSPYPQQAQT